MLSLLLVAVLAAPPGRPSPTATPTPSSADEAEEPSPFAPTPSPTPTPGTPHLIAALDITQGDSGERTAAFDDGALIHVVRYKGRMTTTKKNLTVSERELIRLVVDEARAVPDEGERRSPVLLEVGRRLVRVEVGDPRTGLRTFTFDDVTPLPLPLGRARGALEDLRQRFVVDDTPKEQLWDPSGLKEGALLRRRTDGKWFLVARDDSFEKNLELQEAHEQGVRLFVPREDVPRIFADPALNSAHTDERRP